MCNYLVHFSQWYFLTRPTHNLWSRVVVGTPFDKTSKCMHLNFVVSVRLGGGMAKAAGGMTVSHRCVAIAHLFVFQPQHTARCVCIKSHRSKSQADPSAVRAVASPICSCGRPSAPVRRVLLRIACSFFDARLSLPDLPAAPLTQSASVFCLPPSSGDLGPTKSRGLWAEFNCKTCCFLLLDVLRASKKSCSGTCLKFPESFLRVSARSIHDQLLLAPMSSPTCSKTPHQPRAHVESIPTFSKRSHQLQTPPGCGCSVTPNIHAAARPVCMIEVLRIHLEQKPREPHWVTASSLTAPIISTVLKSACGSQLLRFQHEQRSWCESRIIGHRCLCTRQAICRLVGDVDSAQKAVILRTRSCALCPLGSGIHLPSICSGRASVQPSISIPY